MSHRIEYIATMGAQLDLLRRIQLERKRHIEYLKRGLNGLGRWGSSLDASKPWLVYWIFHSLDLLEYKFDSNLIAR